MIAGQGTIGLELAEQLPDARDVRCSRSAAAGSPAGIAIALRALRPGVRLVGVQAGAAATTIADGIAVKEPGELTMSILDELLDDLVDVDRRGDQRGDHAAARALEAGRRGRRRASASPRCSPARSAATGGVCALLSGGNIDPTLLISVMRHGLAAAGRYLVDAHAASPTGPGELIKLLELVAERARQHRRGRAPARGRGARASRETEVELTVVTRNEEHCGELCAALEARGLRARPLALSAHRVTLDS